MKCNICGRITASIRDIDTARITGKAHIDCNGHSEYRHVSKEEIEEVVCVVCYRKFAGVRDDD
jgi:ribosomal protein S14